MKDKVQRSAFSPVFWQQDSFNTDHWLPHRLRAVPLSFWYRASGKWAERKWVTKERKKRAFLSLFRDSLPLSPFPARSCFALHFCSLTLRSISERKRAARSLTPTWFNLINTISLLYTSIWLLNYLMLCFSLGCVILVSARDYKHIMT